MDVVGIQANENLDLSFDMIVSRIRSALTTKYDCVYWRRSPGKNFAPLDLSRVSHAGSL